MKEIFGFTGLPASGTAFAVTVSATGGESLEFYGNNGHLLLALNIDADRIVDLRVFDAVTGWTYPIRIDLPQVRRGDGVGFQFTFGQASIALSIDGVQCFCAGLDETWFGLEAVRGEGEWIHPCVWSLLEPVAEPIRLLRPEDIASIKAEGLVLFGLSLGSEFVHSVVEDLQTWLIVEPDVVRIFKAEQAFRHRKTMSRRIYIHASSLAFKREKDADRDLNSGGNGQLVQWADVVSAIGVPNMVLISDFDAMKMLREMIEADGMRPACLIAPWSAEICSSVTGYGYNRFNLFRRQSLALFPKPDLEAGFRRRSPFSAEALKSIAEKGNDSGASDYLLQAEG